MNGVAPDGGLLEHLQVEHHKLNCRLAAIQQRMNDSSAGDTGCWPSEVMDALDALRVELIAHLAEEEVDGCLGEAAARCPSAASQLKSIAADHEQLLQSVDRLIAAVAGNAIDHEQWTGQFQLLADRLHALETAETHLLQYALGGDVAEYDVEGNE